MNSERAWFEPTSAGLRRRLEWVGRWRSELVSQRDELCGLMEDEVGKPPFEGLTSDLLPLLASCRWHERNARRVLGERRLSGLPLVMWAVRQREIRAPLGTVGIIATWNYPVQLLGCELLSAVVAGNRVIVKPSENAPRTQGALLASAEKAGLPPGVLTVLPATREAGAELLERQGIDHLTFTGSTAVGRMIARRAGERLLPTTLELSGRDSAFVLGDADAVLAARSIFAAVTINGGQTCMAPRRVLVEPEAYGPFVAALRPLAGGARARRLMSAEMAARCHGLAAAALDAGGRSASGVCEPNRGREFTPLAVVDCPEDAALVAGDHFGPVVAVIPVPNIERALEVHGRVEQHLSASIYTRSRARARALAPRLSVSNVTINDSVIPQASPASGIAGFGQSGWGVTKGRDGLLAMSRPIYLSTTGRLGRFSTQTPPERVRRALGGVLEFLYR
ncbi:MAG: aldehyde dehydrogenase family protein [Phycisphaerales bacterium]